MPVKKRRVGRPVHGRVGKNYRLVSVNVTHEEYEYLRQRAAKTYMNMSVQIRLMIQKSITEERVESAARAS